MSGSKDKDPNHSGRHDATRDGQGKPQPEKWQTSDKKDDGNKHGKG